ncbi:uncharacterized protein [Erythrolamprus reginae]|uniref:uncharacterized protein n=1 Tax=Erythrolamprus reginae TaxID=121349 RepID=UPI00396C75E7
MKARRKTSFNGVGNPKASRGGGELQKLRCRERSGRKPNNRCLRPTQLPPHFVQSGGGGGRRRGGGVLSFRGLRGRGGGRKRNPPAFKPARSRLAQKGGGGKPRGGAWAGLGCHKWRPSGRSARKAARATAAAPAHLQSRHRWRVARSSSTSGRQNERAGIVGAVGGAAVGGDPPGRAGEAERQPLPAVEEEAGGAEQGEPEPLRGRQRGRRQGPRQGAALRLHPEGGLRGAHGQVRLLHHRHHGPQGDRLSVPGRELLERLHHHGAHRLPEQARHPGLQEPAGGRRAGGGGQSRPALGPGALNPPVPPEDQPSRDYTSG